VIDLLLIEPSLDFRTDQEFMLSRRIEPDLPRNETPPLGFGYMMAVAARNGLDVKFLDMIAYSLSVADIIKYIHEWEPIVVGFSAYTIKINSINLIAEAIKQSCPDVLICCGGAHFNALPKETLEEFQSIDFGVCGEADEIIVNIINDIKNNKDIHTIPWIVTRQSKTVTKNKVPDLNALPFPAWDMMRLDKYPGSTPHLTKQEIPMVTSRGCPFRCVFCAKNHGNIRRERTQDSIIAEINHNIEKYNCETISFLDETFIINTARSARLFQRFIDDGITEKIKWACEGRVDIGDPDLFKLMKKSGCYYMFFGLESGDDNILKIAKKGITVKQIKSTIRAAQNAGIICIGAFIIGLPGETETTVQKSIALAEELDMYSTTFPIAVPLPGSELRRMALNHEYGLKILSNDWSLYGKQYPGIMESAELSMEDRLRLQKEAYIRNPKKTFPRHK
jgi:radical SAM superfamily enzyme YgiQ (UPF0313 family)